MRRVAIAITSLAIVISLAACGSQPTDLQHITSEPQSVESFSAEETEIETTEIEITGAETEVSTLESEVTTETTEVEVEEDTVESEIIIETTGVETAEADETSEALVYDIYSDSDIVTGVQEICEVGGVILVGGLTESDGAYGPTFVFQITNTNEYDVNVTLTNTSVNGFTADRHTDKMLTAGETIVDKIVIISYDNNGNFFEEVNTLGIKVTVDGGSSRTEMEFEVGF